MLANRRTKRQCAYLDCQGLVGVLVVLDQSHLSQVDRTQVLRQFLICQVQAVQVLQ